MNSKSKRFLLVLFLTLFVSALAACSGGGDAESSSEEDGTADSSEPKEGGTLNIGLAANPKTLDPIDYTGIYESQIMGSVIDTLVSYNQDFSEVEPSLATEWEVSDDLTEYTFKLREDVYFQPGEYQDGRQMTAEDVKYSIERSQEESSMDRITDVEEVEVVDDFTVTIHLEQPNATLMAMLTDTGNAIVPKEEVEGWGDDFGTNLVGTGPFKIVDWKADQQVELERNEDYWGETPHLDGVNFKIISDTNMMANALRSGDIDIATEVKGQNREVIEQEEGLELISEPALSIAYLDLNNKQGPTADPDVRRAIYMATNVEEIVQGANQYGGAEVSYLPVPPRSWGYDEDLEDLVPEFDPEAAKELLAEAGYEDGFDTEIYVAEARVPHATIFQNQMEENLGVNVEIKVVEWGTYSDTVSKNNAPMSIGSWNWYPDPYFFLNQLYHSNQIGSLGNGKGYENEEVDKLLDKAKTETADQAERTEIYQEVLEIVLKDTPRIELEVQDATAGVAEKVQGFHVSANPGTLTIVDSTGTNIWLNE